MNSSRQLSSWVLVLALVCLFLDAGFLRAQSPEPDKILFLHLRMKDGVITLVKTATTHGVLKARRSADKKGPIQLEVETAAGALLWSEKMSDPSVRRYEYEDPDNPGAIKSKVVQLNEVEFTVRVPFKKEARRVSFYRAEAASEKDKSPTPRTLKAPQPAKKLIATIDLPSEEAK